MLRSDREDDSEDVSHAHAVLKWRAPSKMFPFNLSHHGYRLYYIVHLINEKCILESLSHFICSKMPQIIYQSEVASL